MQEKHIQKRKNSLLKKVDKIGEGLKGHIINEKDEKKRKLHLDLLAASEKVKNEGIDG